MTQFQISTDSNKDIEIWKDLKKFLIINFCIALLIQFFFCPICFLSWSDLTGLLPDFMFSFSISMALSWGGSRIQEYFDSRISWIHEPVKRLLVTIITYISYAFVVSFVIVFFYFFFENIFTFSNIPWKRVLSFTMTPMTIALIFMAIFTTRSWLFEWRKSAIEAEQLRTEKIASKYQSLKDQLNPHFLFNCLNVLSSLVYEDADKSVAFIQKLSKIYRYVLEVQKDELVELDKELGFAKNYLELQKIRFGENLQFSIHVIAVDGYLLPPLSLQLLLENAIKHNILSQKDPLFIQILQKENELWISNSFQPKSSQSESSTGVGLENIRLRYQHLSSKNIEVTQGENEFIVRLPLLQIEA